MEKVNILPQDFKEKLKNRLAGAEKIAIIGIGSDIKGDDYAGVAIAKQLEKDLQTSGRRPDIKIFIAGNAPENITGEIKRFKPSHIIILDCADMGMGAGEAGLIDPEKIGGASMDTHRLPIKMFAGYLHSCLGCQIIIIGIQPKSLGFNNTLSQEVKKSVDSISSVIKEICGF